MSETFSDFSQPGFFKVADGQVALEPGVIVWRDERRVIVRAPGSGMYSVPLSMREQSVPLLAAARRQGVLCPTG